MSRKVALLTNVTYAFGLISAETQKKGYVIELLSLFAMTLQCGVPTSQS